MMYLLVKKIVKGLPRRWLRVLEPYLRRAWGLFYAGNSVYCSVCRRSYRGFIPAGRAGDLLCPGCGALPRTRFLARLLDRVLGQPTETRVLHVSPEPALKRRLKRMQLAEYTCTDYESDAEPCQWDLTCLPVPDHSFSLVICFHVLEHIQDDAAAIRELFRVLSPGGIALVQTPFCDAEITIEHPDAGLVSPEERQRRYGQQDHVRIYALGDLCLRMQHAGFLVDCVRAEEVFSVQEAIQEAINPGSVAVIGRRAITS